jgi:plasmid stabilization system protein ParE
MTKLTLIINDAAQKDLLHIKDYLSQTFGAEITNRIMRELANQLKSLADFPNLGRSATEIGPYLTGYDYYHTDKITVIYKKSKTDLIILKIYDNRSDIGVQIEGFLHEDSN